MGGVTASWPLLPAAAVLAAALLYGHWRMADNVTDAGPRIALVQGSIDIKMRYDKGMKERIFQQYYGLSREAVEKYPGLDLVVWPESMFLTARFNNVGHLRRRRPAAAGFRRQRGRVPPVASAGRRAAAVADGPRRPGGWACRCCSGWTGTISAPTGRSATTRRRTSAATAACWAATTRCTWSPSASTSPSPTAGPGCRGSRRCRSALPRARSRRRSSFAGRQSRPLWRIAPNICYETVLPQVIRRQVNALAAEGREPDILVNLTNDGWFWGSSELDMHLACGVFRAVECRKPLLVAANTGFSAWIDGDGNIRATRAAARHRHYPRPAPPRPPPQLVSGPRGLAGGGMPGGVRVVCGGGVVRANANGFVPLTWVARLKARDGVEVCRTIHHALAGVPPQASPPVMVQSLNTPGFPLSRLLVDMRNWAKLY